MKVSGRLALGFVAVLMGFVIIAPPRASASQGQDLFREKGCTACHSIAGEGGDAGPALDTVGDRYSAEWLYTWLKDPEAVKPGTQMPDLDLSDGDRGLLVFYLLTLSEQPRQIAITPTATRGVKSDPPDLNPASPENTFLTMGVGGKYVAEQRYTLQDQIQSFIPPLFEPTFTESAFVLPAGAARIAVAYRNVGTIKENDFAGEREFGARIVDFDVKRSFLDFDGFLGLDDNLTLRVNVPFSQATMSAAVNPAFNDMVTAFPTGSLIKIGDVKLFLKKKFVDQGNFPVAIAGVASVSLPTGANGARFDPRTTVNIGGMNMILPLPAVGDDGMPIPGTDDGTFRRFSNDGRLPATLQPGLGTVGGAVSAFVTRVFEGGSILGRGAAHAGALYELRPSHGGVDPGNLLTAFATLVKPVIGDTVSLDLTYVAMYQEKDSYAGKMLAPTPMGPMVVDRPPFSGGTTQFVGASLSIIPNPLFKLTVSSLVRVAEPDLGPSPSYVFRIAFQHTFATGLYRLGKQK